MDYIQLKCLIVSSDLPLVQEILTYELAQLGFESFSEITDGLLAYIAKKDFNEQSLDGISFHKEMNLGDLKFSWETIKDKNWNEEWEKNFQPVLIADKCYIRSPFHAPRPESAYEIIIEPKMSFGTGHHETTSLMMEQMFSIDFTDKVVLDMGSGTGVLAILASMLHANHITAIDIDEWAYNNSIENCTVNNISNISIFQGDAQLLADKTFDIVLANINRNILLNDIDKYALCLKPGGLLLVSGIYTFDLKIIKKTAESCGLNFQKSIEKNNWISALFIK